MEYIRPYRRIVAFRSLAVAAVAAAVLALMRQYIPAVALIAGAMICLASMLSIAGSFDRLMKAGKGYMPFLSLETIVRVLLAGGAPFIIVGRGPWLGYFTYLAGFVATLAVAILVYRQQVVYGRDDPAA